MTFDELLLNVKVWEGFRSTRYVDAAGVKTIGYGFTASCFEGGVVPSRITKDAADDLLVAKLVNVSKDVSRRLYDCGYSTAEHDVMLLPLTDFTYNCGLGNLDKLIKNGSRSVYEVADKLLEYNKADGRVLEGLNRRRAWEREKLLAGAKTLDGKLKTPVVCYTVKYLQALLNEKYGAKLDVDGIIGNKTLKCVIDTLLK